MRQHVAWLSDFMSFFSEKNGTILIVALFVLTLCAVVLVDPIPQDTKYHNFSDTRAIFSVPNMLNVFSNIPFIVVGVLGLILLGRGDGDGGLNIVSQNRLSYWFLFLGSVLVGAGSGYYHLWPDNATLVWDRMPMTIAFMALYSIIISEFVSEKLGRLCLFPFLIIGIGSVLYWWFTESQGVGDLRFYAVVQFFPVVTIPVFLVFFKSKFSCVWSYWLLFLTYIGAKIVELLDSQIHNYINFVSGHSIKHVLPAIGLYILIRAYSNRAAVPGDEPISLV